MGPPAARNAQGLMVATGPRALFESVEADLARMTGRLDYMGERTDLAAVNKLLGNAMIIGVSAVMADVLTLAKACGVDAGDAVGLLGALDMNAIVARRGKSMATGDFTPSFELVDGAQGCATDARDFRRPAHWRRCPRSPHGWMS